MDYNCFMWWKGATEGFEYWFACLGAFLCFALGVAVHGKFRRAGWLALGVGVGFLCLWLDNAATDRELGKWTVIYIIPLLWGFLTYRQVRGGEYHFRWTAIDGRQIEGVFLVRGATLRGKAFDLAGGRRGYLFAEVKPYGDINGECVLGGERIVITGACREDCYGSAHWTFQADDEQLDSIVLAM